MNKIPKSFKHKDLCSVERVKTAMRNRINAEAEVKAAIELGYIPQEKFDELWDKQAKGLVEERKYELITAIKANEKKGNSSSLEDMFNDLK